MGYRLRIVAGPGLGSEVSLDPGELTIGRSAENGLVINDSNVSRVHAKVNFSGGNRITVRDNGSRNGVYVNDKKVDQFSIALGDRVVIGQTVIEVQDDSENGASARPGTDRGKGASPAPAVKRANVVKTGAMESAAPSSSRPPATRTGGVAPANRTGATPANRTGPAAVSQRGPGSPAARSPGVRPTPPKGGNNTMLFGGLGLAGVAAVVGFFLLNPGSKTAGTPGSVVAKPRTTVTPPPFPGGFDETIDQIEVKRFSVKVQEQIDLGDSNRVSGNLSAARLSFREAVRLDPSCKSCKVRLEAVDREIDVKIAEYEKAGILLDQSGSYQQAIDRWKIAMSYIGDPKSPRSMTFQRKITETAKKIETQPQ